MGPTLFYNSRELRGLMIRMRNTIVCLGMLSILFWNSSLALAQDISGSIELHIDSIIDNLPGSSGGDYVEPSTDQRSNWGGIVSGILQGDYGMPDSMNYHLLEFLDVNSGATYYILEEKSPKQFYWGTYIFNPNPCRTKLVIQSPHPKYDFNTGKEGIFCFERLGALAYFLSGTHRCNSSQASSCSGTTSSCGSSASFRISDMPHATTGMFHETTVSIVSEIQEAVFIQLHGFSKQSTDPYVILSNGTRDTPADDHIPSITSGLLQVDPSLTFKVAHIDTTWTRLIAFTNVQGRYINSSSDPCNTSATVSSGNFIHIEQEKTKLRNDSTGWNKVYQALSSSFPCDSALALGTFSEWNSEMKIFPSPTTGRFTIKSDGFNQATLYNQMGSIVWETEEAKKITQVDISLLPCGIYILVAKFDNMTATQKIVKW